MFEGEKKGPNPTDCKLQINKPQNPSLVSCDSSYLKGKAGGVEDSQEVPKHVGPDVVCVIETGPTTTGLSLGNLSLPLYGLDMGQEESSNQDSITKPIYLKTSQEVQGRKWTRLERPTPVKTSHHTRLSLTRERSPPKALDTQPVKKREVSNNDSPSLSVSMAVAFYQPCRSP